MGLHHAWLSDKSFKVFREDDSFSRLYYKLYKDTGRFYREGIRIGRHIFVACNTQ